MKQVIRIAVFLIIFSIVGCSDKVKRAPTSVNYSSSVTLSKGEETGQHNLAFIIEDISNPEKPTILSSPRLSVQKGEEAQLSIEDDEDDIIYTVLVNTKNKIYP